MKKKIIMRSLLGFPLGIAMGYLITILISLCWANGYYSPCAPELISVMGNEINAVILQTVLCGILGTGFAASSVIWEMEHCKTDRNLFFNYFGNNAANCLFCILDETWHSWIFNLFWDFYIHFCDNMDYKVCYRKT